MWICPLSVEAGNARRFGRSPPTGNAVGHGEWYVTPPRTHGLLKVETPTLTFVKPLLEIERTKYAIPALKGNAYLLFSERGSTDSSLGLVCNTKGPASVRMSVSFVAFYGIFNSGRGRNPSSALPPERPLLKPTRLVSDCGFAAHLVAAAVVFPGIGNQHSIPSP